MVQGNLYERVVEVTTVYLGPAADRFVSRQIRNHLNKEPRQLVKQDLRSLIDWIEVAMSLISNDTELVAEYMKELQGLAGSPKKLKNYAKNSHRQ